MRTHLPIRVIIAPSLLLLAIFSGEVAEADSFRLIIAGDPQFPWGCCNCNDESVLQTNPTCWNDCDNKICNWVDEDDFDQQAEEMNRAYVDAMNVLYNTDESIRAVVINGDLTAYGRSGELKDFQEFYEDDLEAPLWIGLGNHDIANPLETGCNDNDCPMRMVSYLNEFVTQLGVELESDGLAENFDFDFSVGELVRGDWYNYKELEGSLAYSFDMGEFHFVQLNDYVDYTAEFTSWNGSGYDQRVNITSSVSWLRHDLRQARERDKRIVLFMHQATSKDVLEQAIVDTNVEAVFVAHTHENVGEIGSLDNTYPSRSDYRVPRYYSGSPQFGQFLVATFEDGQPIQVQVIDISGVDTEDTSITAESQLALGVSWTGLNPADPFLCELSGAIDAAFDFRPDGDEPLATRDSIRKLISGARTWQHQDSEGLENCEGEELRTTLTTAALFFSDIDAAAAGPGASDFYLFKEGSYLHYEGLPSGVVRSMDADFAALPVGFRRNLDAAYGTPWGVITFLKGAETLDYNVIDGEVVFTPRPIASAWPDLPLHFQSDLDAAYFTGADRAILIRGNRFAEVDIFGVVHDLGLIESELRIDVPNTVVSTAPGEDCSSPVRIYSGRDYAFDNRQAVANWPFFAIDDGVIVCHDDFGKDQWFEWVAPRSGFAEFRVSPSGACGEVMVFSVYELDPLVDALCGEDVADLDLPAALVDCDAVRCAQSKSIWFLAGEGVRYGLRIGSAPPSPGAEVSGSTGMLRVVQGFPESVIPNDYCFDALGIAGDGIFSGAPENSTAGATLDQNLAVSAACDPFERDSWLIWSCRVTGRVTMDFSHGSGLETQLEVYDAAPCYVPSRSIACDSGTVSRVEFHGVRGEDYVLRSGVIGSGGIPSGQRDRLVVSTVVDDAYEPNQGCLSATFIAQGGSRLSAIAGDEDWYRVRVPARVAATVLLEADPRLGVPKLLALEGCDPGLRDRGRHLNPFGAFLDNPGPTATTFFLVVYPERAAANPLPYTLRVSMEASSDDVLEPNDTAGSALPLRPGSYAGLRVGAGDADWYAVDVPRGGFLEVETSSDFILDLAVFYAPEDRVPSRRGFGAGQSARVEMPERDNGSEYRIQVSADTLPVSGDYDLSFRVHDRYSGNDACDEAVRIAPGGHSDLVITNEEAVEHFIVEVPAGYLLRADLDRRSPSGVILSGVLLESCSSPGFLATSVPVIGGTRRIEWHNDGATRIVVLRIEYDNPDESTGYYDLDITLSRDCDGNGVDDITQIAVQGDCDGNGVPDVCDPDSDQNSVPDACEVSGRSFRRADCNDDGRSDLSDAVCILSWLFTGGARPVCLSGSDTNASGAIDLSDAVYLLSHLFLGSAPPVQPYPNCGVSELASDAELGCEVSNCE